VERASVTPGDLLLSAEADRLELAATGAWVVAVADTLEKRVERAAPPAAGTLVLDLARVEALDVYGAWLLQRLVRDATARGQSIRVESVPERFRALLERVAETNRRPARAPERTPLLLAPVERTGRAVIGAGADLLGLVATIGALAGAFGRAVLRPASLRFTSIVHHLDRVGWQAVPIVLLITFLIGCIIAQQAIFHFRKFGADDYVVDLVGILILREIGVLLVAIMVAGRSGSAYTAELGSMKMREEIDALRTMGRDPVEVLMLPRVLALLLALPMLTFLGAMAALFGAGLVAWLYGDMAPAIFLSRLQEAVSTTELKVGMVKAPFIALVIGAIACREGLAVKGSAESLGLHTTSSVVKAIFLVIVLDGLFAIFFASIGM
jgi:phospholipid/cholesterol/gamma-HCH transport system permease protein